MKAATGRRQGSRDTRVFTTAGRNGPSCIATRTSSAPSFPAVSGRMLPTGILFISLDTRFGSRSLVVEQYPLLGHMQKCFHVVFVAPPTQNFFSIA